MSMQERLAIDAAGAARDREWLVPGAIMTALLGAAAVALMPVAGYSEVPDYFGRFLNWMSYSLFGAIILLLVQLIKLQRAGVTELIAPLKAMYVANRSPITAALAGMVLAGTDILFFMWIKPEVTALAPFRADVLYAEIDRAIFRTDPWRFFNGFDLAFHAWAYSFFWALAIMATLVWLLARPASQERSSALLSYFALWSIFGPVGQMLGSAAGPIFYGRIGLGDRFAGLEANLPDVTQRISGYLWHFHVSGEPAVAAGISAMPSMHIASVVWIYLAFRGQGSRLAPAAALFALYMFVLSVALGWHYAIDGIAGAAGAIVTQSLCKAYLGKRNRAARLREPGR